MTIDFTEEEINVLKRTLGKFPLNPQMTNAIYIISPAQQMRNRADEIEQEERDYPVLQGIIKRLTPLNK